MECTLPRAGGQQFAGAFIFQMGPIFTRSRLSGAASDSASCLKTVALFDLVRLSKGTMKEAAATRSQSHRRSFSRTCESSSSLSDFESPDYCLSKVKFCITLKVELEWT